MAEFMANDFSNRFNPDSDFYLDIEQITMHERIGGGEFSDVYLGSYFGDKARARRARARWLPARLHGCAPRPRARPPVRRSSCLSGRGEAAGAEPEHHRGAAR